MIRKDLLPVFLVRVKGESGDVSERKYKLNTPIVRRVLAPGEKPAAPSRRSKAKSTAHRGSKNK